jgi:hypothetical protein
MSWIPRVDACWMRWHHELTLMARSSILVRAWSCNTSWLSNGQDTNNSIWCSICYCTLHATKHVKGRKTEHAIPTVGFFLYFQGPISKVLGGTSVEKLRGGTDIKSAIGSLWSELLTQEQKDKVQWQHEELRSSIQLPFQKQKYKMNGRHQAWKLIGEEAVVCEKARGACV